MSRPGSLYLSLCRQGFQAAQPPRYQGSVTTNRSAPERPIYILFLSHSVRDEDKLSGLLTFELYR